MLTRILFVAVLAFSSIAAKCATNSAGPGGTVTDAAIPVADGGFDYCTDKNVQSVASGLQGDIASALATSDYEAAIAELIAKFTAGEVKCAIQIFIGGSSRKASADQLVAQEISRGKAYLASHP